VCMQTFRLSEDVLQYLSALSMFNCDEKEIESHGYFKCVDYPELTKHIYYEGYFHSKPTSKTTLSVHPRKGHEYHKPAAPLPLRAFFEAFRKVNSEWINDLKSKLFKLVQGEIKKTEQKTEQTETEELENAAEVFLRLINADHLFGDLAIQFHYGTGVSDDHLGWHTDAINSLLHMATAIKSRRGLHSHRAKKI